MQVVSFRVLDTEGDPDEVAGRLNAVLPASMGIACSRVAKDKFHAQWRSVGKEYRYRIALSDQSAWAPYSWRIDVEPQRLNELLQRCVGTRDFIAFHEHSSQQMPRTVRSIDVVTLPGNLLDVRIVGDGFARYMVRYLLGSAVKVARGEVSEEAFMRGVNEAAAFTGLKAPARGLILWEVRYPFDFDPFFTDRVSSNGVPKAPPFHIEA